MEGPQLYCMSTCLSNSILTWRKQECPLRNHPSCNVISTRYTFSQFLITQCILWGTMNPICIASLVRHDQYIYIYKYIGPSTISMWKCTLYDLRQYIVVSWHIPQFVCRSLNLICLLTNLHVFQPIVLYHYCLENGWITVKIVLGCPWSCLVFFKSPMQALVVT